MTGVADHAVAALARDMVRAVDGGMRVLAVTTTSSLVAGRLAQRLDDGRLALAVGFGVLDAGPEPALTLGEFALRSDSAAHGPIEETFVALARGRAGVVVTPAQLDADCATNLSRIGGDELPGLALPGSRGLPENNHSPSRVWYVLPEHSRRTLVRRVDFVSGAPPARCRQLVTRLGVLEYAPGHGWTVTAVMPGVSVDDVRDSTAFDLRVAEPEVPTCHATERETELLAEIDPHRLRRLEFTEDAAVAGRLVEEQTVRENDGVTR